MRYDVFNLIVRLHWFRETNVPRQFINDDFDFVRSDGSVCRILFSKTLQNVQRIKILQPF